MRFLSTNEAKDERSEDEDETEFELVEGTTIARGETITPQVTLNGEPFSPIEAPGTGNSKAGLRKR